MTRRAKALHASKQFVKQLAICAALLLVAGAVYAKATSSGLRFSFAAVLFIGGAMIFVVSALSGGSGRRRRTDLYAYGRQASPAATDMPFGWVMVSLGLIGLGALTAAL
jgi:hypothetical protein